MKRDTLVRVVLPIVSIVWLVSLFFLGWKTILWTVIGGAIATIIKQLKENVQDDDTRDYKSNKECKKLLSE